MHAEFVPTLKRLYVKMIYTIILSSDYIVRSGEDDAEREEVQHAQHPVWEGGPKEGPVLPPLNL